MVWELGDELRRWLGVSELVERVGANSQSRHVTTTRVRKTAMKMIVLTNLRSAVVLKQIGRKRSDRRFEGRVQSNNEVCALFQKPYFSVNEDSARAQYLLGV